MEWNEKKWNEMKWNENVKFKNEVKGMLWKEMKRCVNKTKEKETKDKQN